MTEIVKLDYNLPPPSYESLFEAELALASMGRAPQPKHRTDALVAVWAHFKNQCIPPGLAPHPWASKGEPFKYACVTPCGCTLLDTVGVVREVALAAAWRWYDIRLALTLSGEGGGLFEWPGILNATDSDIQAALDRRLAKWPGDLDRG